MVHVFPPLVIPAMPQRATVSEAEKLLALDRMRQHLRAEFAHDVQAEIVRDFGPIFTKIFSRVLLTDWLVRDGAASFVDSDAQCLSENAVSTAYSESQIDDFVHVFNEHLIEEVRFNTAFFYAATRGWVFQIAAEYAHAIFSWSTSMTAQ